MPDAWISLDAAARHTRTGDLWLFRGNAVTDRAIHVLTRSPVNHVGMAVVIDGHPPLLWHADAAPVLPDVWSGTRHGGAQLHDLRGAVLAWSRRFGQRAWLRHLDHAVDRRDEDAVLRTVSALDGAPYPPLPRLASGWLRERAGRLARFLPDRQGALDCAQVVAGAYEAMGLLPPDRPPSWYDPGRFWSGSRLRLARGARLLDEVAVRIPPRSAGLARGL